MPLNPSHMLVSSVAILVMGAAANASVISAPNPSTYSDLVASFDPIANGYNWPANSGHVWLQDFGAGPVIADQTQIRSDVFRVNQNVTVGTGANTLGLVPGDMVFSYTITLVKNVPNETVTMLSQFKASGTIFSGADILEAGFVKGLGWVSTTSITPSTTQLAPPSPFGSFVDYNWPLGGQGLENEETITLLMYTQPSALGFGTGNFAVPAGQPGGLDEFVQFNGIAPQVYIPKIPAPGAASVMLLGGLTVLRRRR